MLSAAAAMAVTIAGCGGSSSSSAVENTAATGTGYYLDNAVVGADYECGSQKGKTGEGGKFTFEKGKPCTFKLASIPLRSVDASELVDGKKIVEDDPKVARLLQSIDSDGDLSNGIQISDAVIEAIEAALAHVGTAPEAVFEQTGTLEDIVETVEDEVPTVTGLVSQEDAQAHVNETKTEVTKALIAGKTFYEVDEDEDEPVLRKVQINESATQVTVTNLETNEQEIFAITIEGNKLMEVGENEGYNTVELREGYIALVWHEYATHETDENRFYENRADAEAYMATLGGAAGEDTGGAASGVSETQLRDAFIGKELYRAKELCSGGETKVKKIVVSNGTMDYLEDGTLRGDDMPFSLSGNVINITVSNSLTVTLSALEITDRYIKFDHTETGQNGSDIEIWYYSENDARAHQEQSDNECSNAGTAFTEAMLSANPWYRVEYTDEELYCNGKFTFDMNHGLTAEWLETGRKKAFFGHYSLENGKLVTTHDGKIEEETLSSASASRLDAEKVARDAQTGEVHNTMSVVYFADYDEMLSFGQEHGADCDVNIPR